MKNELSRSFYRETVQGSGVADGKIIRQQGGIGVYAHVRVEVRALSRGQGTTLAWNAGLNIPAKFISAVLEGIQDVLNAGVLTGLEMADIAVSIEDGSYHEEDSTTDAFREAAKLASVEAIQQARPIVLEALSSVTITVPLSFIEFVEGTVAAHGGKTKAETSKSYSRTLEASIPSSNVNDLIVELVRNCEGFANITSRADGFRSKPEPPDSLGTWAAIT
jgi:elongation factor G